jgi:hypothetical protein
MIFRIGILILVIVLFAIKCTNKSTATKQRILIAVSLSAEIIAVISGGAAGSAKASNSQCHSTPITQYIAWALGIVGLIIACSNLYLAVRGKKAIQIVVAILFLIVCLVALGLAWFLSDFCLTG